MTEKYIDMEVNFLELAQQVKEVDEGASTETTDLDTLRADEYEKLARLCIDKKQ